MHHIESALWRSLMRASQSVTPSAYMVFANTFSHAHAVFKKASGCLQDSFGSASWLVQREGGNIMMDSPRFDAKLLARIKVLAWHRAMQPYGCLFTRHLCSSGVS